MKLNADSYSNNALESVKLLDAPNQRILRRLLRSFCIRNLYCDVVSDHFVNHGDKNEPKSQCGLKEHCIM